MYSRPARLSPPQAVNYQVQENCTTPNANFRLIFLPAQALDCGPSECSHACPIAAGINIALYDYEKYQVEVCVG